MAGIGDCRTKKNEQKQVRARESDRMCLSLLSLSCLWLKHSLEREKELAMY